MSIHVRYFASLKERVGRSEERVMLSGPLTAEALWRHCLSEPPPERILVAVNLEYADWDSPVKDGDEVAFFPPVTGG